MIILVDSRETTPWKLNCQTQVVGLPTGDYSLPGYESTICIERKTINDLVNTLINDWQRFSRQLRRMAAMDIAFIVCDCPMSRLTNKEYVSDALPQSVRGKINHIHVNYGVPTVFWDSPEIAAAWTENLFQKYLDSRSI